MAKQPTDLTNAKRVRSLNADAVELNFCRDVLEIYHDMKLISGKDYKAVKDSDDVRVIDEKLTVVPELTDKQQLEFSERFVKRIYQANQNVDTVSPGLLADAYKSLKKSDKDEDKQLLGAVRDRIDALAAEFYSFNGAGVLPTEDEKRFLNFIDVTNIADTYDGYNKMFAARLEDSDVGAVELGNTNLKDVLTKNQQQIEATLQEYDQEYGLSDVSDKNAGKIEKHLDDVSAAVGKVEITEDKKQDLSKYKFLDQNGNPIPQFRDKKGKLVSDYAKGCTIDEQGRLQSVVDLARHEVVLRHAAKVDEKIDDKALASEVNEELLYKLYEIDTAEKIISGAENPEQFTDPKYRDDFIKNLRKEGGKISDSGYQAAMDYQVNQTAGFAARLKAKVKGSADKIKGVFSKLFKPISNIDKRSKARFAKSATPEDKRKKRIDFFVRILKGFASAFLVSAAITTIATAGAALAGVSLAAGLAAVGVIVAIAKSAVQIHKWRKNQKAKGLPCDIKAFIKDKRLVASLGTSALGAVAMVFGAAGLAQVAIPLGYGALAIGSTTSAIQMYRDAKDAHMSTAESLVWSLANVAATIGGGFAGRAAANYGISEYNKAHPDNEIFQKKVSEGHEAWDERVQRQEYTPEALEHAKDIATRWYQDNPDLLQQRVEAIEAYNAEHGTTIDPYRAIVLNGDAGGVTADNMGLHADYNPNPIPSHGHHTVFGAGWAHEHGIDMSEVNALKHLFNADGSINPDGMAAAQKIDPMVSAINEVGVVSNGDSIAHRDGWLHQNTTLTDGETPVFNTYANGESPFHIVEDTIRHDGVNSVYEPINNSGMGMFGQYAPKTTSEKIRDRLGSLADAIFGPRKEPTPQEPERQEETPVVPVEDERNGLPAAPERKGLPGGEEYKGLPGGEEHKGLPGGEERKGLPGGEERKGLPGATDGEFLPIAPEGEDLSEDRKALPGAEKSKDILEISRSDAKKWNDLHDQLDRIQLKRKSKNLPAGEANDLKRQEKTIKQEINRLYNKFGRPSQNDLNTGVDYALKKDILNSKQEQLSKVEAELQRLEGKKDEVRKAALVIAQRKLQRKIEQLQTELMAMQVMAANPDWIYESRSVENNADNFNSASQRIKKKQPQVSPMYLGTKDGWTVD